MEKPFHRQDWILFRTLSGLSQKAGVPSHELPKVLVKELVDNALDASETCRSGLLDENGFFVEDDGPGIPGSPEEVASLFSISRSLTSSKLLRLPTRGALGNGIRVVVGAVLASGGRLKVRTNGTWMELIPKETGDTEVRVIGQTDEDSGTRIEVYLGDGLDLHSSRAFQWARIAMLLAGRERMYKGRTSAHWYDGDAFYELCCAAESWTVRELLSSFDGLAAKDLGEIAVAFRGRTADSLTREESERILVAAREVSKKVKPTRLQGVGREMEDYIAYSKVEGTFTVNPGQGDLQATVPYLLEVWAAPNYEHQLTVCVNRTPITAEVEITRSEEKKIVGIFGCGLQHGAEVGRKSLEFLLNVTTPYMPITSDGKAPDLSHFHYDIISTLEKAARSVRRNSPLSASDKKCSQKNVVLHHLNQAIEKASGGGLYRYSIRQLYYAVRPYVLKELNIELKYSSFEAIVTDYENAFGQDLSGIYRDNRGSIYHPHEGRVIPLGTLSVEEYEQPAWTFNKILYIEKEGFVSILRDVKWPERHDCALLTSKGFPSRAARDLLDLLGEEDEELLFFCVHDADASGTLIYQSLQEATRARPGRKVKVINLGLEVEEGRAMGLDYETIDRGDRGRPVADYVSEEDRVWLQAHRYELNAMDTPQFLEWLDGKMAEYGQGKVVPPTHVLRSTLEQKTRSNIRERSTEQVLREARIDDRVEQSFKRSRIKIDRLDGELELRVWRELESTPENSWRVPVGIIATDMSE